MKFKVISRLEAEESVSKYDSRGNTYSDELRNDIIKDILFGAKLQYEKDNETLYKFFKSNLREMRKKQD